MTSYHVEQRLNNVITAASSDIANLNARIEICERNHKRTQLKLGVLGVLVLLSFIF